MLSRSIASLPHAERVNALASDDLLSEACARVSRNLTAEEWRQYLRQEPCRETCPNLP